MRALKTKVSEWISHTPIQFIPTTVQKGLAKGAKWTFLPYSMYWRGHNEQDVEAAIQQHGSIRGAVCWDLGTHFGIYTVGMAMAVGETGQVVGFEPDSTSFQRCQLHVNRNALHWVKLYNAAVSDTEGISNLILSQGAGASTSHLAYQQEQLESEAKLVSIPTVALDRLVNRGEIRPAQFIKIDVEGHGAKALMGARQTLIQHRPTIVMSFHSPAELEETQAVLEPIGYRSYTVEGQALSWSESVFRTTLLRC